jgi:hypothetical protein
VPVWPASVPVALRTGWSRPNHHRAL